jgi:hypothetical protein
MPFYKQIEFSFKLGSEKNLLKIISELKKKKKKIAPHMR